MNDLSIDVVYEKYLDEKLGRVKADIPDYHVSSRFKHGHFSYNLPFIMQRIKENGLEKDNIVSMLVNGEFLYLNYPLNIKEKKLNIFGKEIIIYSEEIPKKIDDINLDFIVVTNTDEPADKELEYYSKIEEVKFRNFLNQTVLEDREVFYSPGSFTYFNTYAHNIGPLWPSLVRNINLYVRPEKMFYSADDVVVKSTIKSGVPIVNKSWIEKLNSEERNDLHQAKYNLSEEGFVSIEIIPKE